MHTAWGRGSAALQALTLDFPGAAALTDESVALVRLRHALAGHRPVEHCALLKLRYLPGRLLQAIYRVEAQGSGDDIVTVTFRREDEGVEAAPPRLDPEASVRVFPDDPALPQLRALVDAAGVSTRLARATGLRLTPDGMSWNLLSYQPGDRCAVRCRWPGAGFDAVGKLLPGAAASHRAMRRLWDLPGRAFRMPQPLASDPERSLRWERHVPGRRFEELAAQAGLDHALATLARGLVDLHDTPLPDLPVRDRHDVLARTEHKVLRRIRGAVPGIAGECEEFVADLARAAALLPPPLPVTVHGDLHTGNILLDEAGLILIDLDSLARGEPAYDLALLGTRLLLFELREGRVSAGTAAAVAGLPERYAACGGDEIPAPVFAWYVAALLVGRQLKTSINHLAPGMAPLATGLLRRAKAVLAAAGVDAELLRSPP